MSAADLARAMPVQPSAVSMWESGRRARRLGASVNTIRRIGERLGLDSRRQEALVGMWQAAGSVLAVAPRQAWTHNYQPPSGPVWLWLRAMPGRQPAAATLEWGAFSGRVGAQISEAGVIVSSPTSVPNPPLQVVFDQPGWVDFGRGIVPDDVAGTLGIQLVDGREIMGKQMPLAPPFAPGEEHVRPLRPWFARARALAGQLGMRWALISPQLGTMRPGRSWHALDATAVEATVWPGATVTDDGGLVSQLLLSPEELRRLRAARGLSRRDAAKAATKLDEVNPLTSKSLEHLETRGRMPESA
ncbi:helix-turn-helix domain-containing protein [Actinoplanes sp. CA-131856]